MASPRRRPPPHPDPPPAPPRASSAHTETVLIASASNVPVRQNESESFQKARGEARSRQNSSDSFKADPLQRQTSDPKEKNGLPKVKEAKVEEAKVKAASPPKKVVSPPQRVSKEATPPPKVTSPPVLISKLVRVNSIVEESPVQKSFKPDVVVKETPRVEKPAFAVANPAPKEKPAFAPTMPLPQIPIEVLPPVENLEEKQEKKVPDPIPTDPANEENNGVGDKIKIFEKAAESAATAGRQSRPGSMRRPRTERLPSDELPPPPPPAELALSPAPLSAFERQPSLTRAEFGSSRWPRNDVEAEEPPKPRPEPQRIVRPEFRPLASPAEVTIRSPSLGAKIPERFPSHGTAFRNVAATPPVPTPVEDEDHHKSCKTRGKCSVSRGSSYFTRGSEEIWLVKKKDIEEIEERVMDSFRRSGGPPTTTASGAATLGRGRRQMYARSESLEPTSVNPRAQTLKRQSSVACTCGHDKKTTRARSADATAPQRTRSRSHGDENNHAHVLDKYETLV